MPAKTAELLCLIDANAYIHRAYHALKHVRGDGGMRNGRGEPTGALFGFARMLLKILREQKPDHVVVCFDTAAPTFRHKSFEAYKATRKEIDDDLKFQLPLAKDLVEAWGIPLLAIDGYEADDLIATLADKGAKEGMKVTVVTADKDALQLVDPNISVLNENKGVLYNEEEVRKKFGLSPNQLVDFFAMTGDAIDNVPGIPGVGPKTAVQILQQFGTLDQALKKAKEIKGSVGEKLTAHRDDVRLCRDLVTLERNAPVGLDPKDCRVRPPDRAKLEGLLTRFEFHSLLPEMLPTETTAVDRRVAVVDSEAALRALVKTLSSARELAVDVETTGTDCFRCDLVGIALAVKPGQAWYIPVGHNYLGCPSQLPLKTVIQELAPFFEDEKLPKTGQNLKFDDLVLRRQDVRLRGISFDTLIASYCLNPSRMTHGLKELARDMLGETMTAIDELIGKGAKQITMDKVEIGPTAQYAAADAEVVLRLKQKMEGLLDERGTKSLFHDVEMPLVGILADMEESGVRVDVKYLQKLQTEFGADIAAIEKEIFDLAGQPLNLNSPKQLSTLLFEKLKLPVIRRTKTGFSTDEEVLRKLGAQHPLPAKLLDYRELSKLKSTYIDALLTLVHPETGRVHTSFNQAVTATGRLSSSDPNLQNIPIRTEHGRRIRRAFVPDKGSVFLSADYSQIDLRVLAHVSQDPVLCEAFRRGEDIHSATAVEIFGLKRGVSPSSDQRRIAKTVNFGIVYGQTAYGLSQQIGLPPHEAQNFIDRYFRRYAGVKKWIESIIEQARRQGCVTTLLNRVRYLPEIQAHNASVRAFAERTAMNTPIQGTSADIIKVAMRDAVAALKENGFKTRLLVQVHDELLFETPQKELARAARLIREKMEKALHLAVPLIVDLKIGPNWSDMEKTEE